MKRASIGFAPSSCLGAGLVDSGFCLFSPPLSAVVHWPHSGESIGALDCYNAQLDQMSVDISQPHVYLRRRIVQCDAGFTLVELLTTVAILAVLLAVAFPSFQAMTNTNRLASHANELMAGIQYARMESLRRNVRTTVCQSSNGTSCSNETTWAGWIVHSDRNRNKVLDAGEVVRVGRVSAPVQLVNDSGITSNRFTFSPDGMARSGTALLNAKLRVCVKTSKPVSNARDVAIAAGSRIVVESVNATIACTSP